jgi:hypothetical protein
MDANTPDWLVPGPDISLYLSTFGLFCYITMHLAELVGVFSRLGVHYLKTAELILMIIIKSTKNVEVCL